MSITYTQFLVELYEDHIDEASAFFEQRIASIAVDVHEWMSAADDEERLEAHIDALVVGGEKALEIAKEAALEGEPGPIYVLVNLYCRYQQLDTLLDFLNNVDLAEVAVRQSVMFALLDQFPEVWTDQVCGLLSASEKALDIFSLFTPALLKKGQFPAGVALEPILGHALVDPVPLIQAAGVSRDKACRNVLANFIIQGDSERKQSALVAMLRLGFHQIVGYTLHNVPAGERPIQALVTGAPLSVFNEQASQSPEIWSEDNLFQLMVGGVAEYIPQLIGILANEALAPMAANALFVITGTRLTASSFIEETWEEDELFADELLAFKEGKVPQRSDGKPYGEEIEELSLDQQHWLSWWQENYTRFVSGKRYRLGRMISPVSLVQSLAHPYLNASMRNVSYHELVIRYNANGHFLVSDFVNVQQQSLRSLYQWAEQVESQYSPGDWYFSGTVQQHQLVQ